MTVEPAGLVQDGVLIAVILLLVGPLGSYMARVYDGGRTLLSPLLLPVERLLYRLGGIDPACEMDWKRYAVAMLLFNGAGFLGLFGLLLFQHLLPLNPQNLPAFAWPLALNTAVSFTTNTNWQNYAGEAAASYFTQMVGFGVHNFVSAASGMAVAIALIRGFVRRKTSSLGNFWADLVRGTLYVLLPLSFAAALALVSQGAIQNFSPYRSATLLQPTGSAQPLLDARGAPVVGAGGAPVTETVTVREVQLPMGPVASQEAIKELGTNGGGFLNANSAHPYENPTPLTNFLELLLILLIPGALCLTSGSMAGSARQGWALLSAMLILFVGSVAVMTWAESGGNPLVARLGVAGGYLEGKETRFGVDGSVLWAATTTATSCGAVNAMHDSLTPLGGMVALSLILLGEVVFGGVGSGLYTMFAFVLIAVFVAGLMIGRTPEYLGKKVEVREMVLAIVTVLAAGAVVLVLSGLAAVLPAASSSLANPGAHGLSEMLYAFASMANNNGSAFAGLNGNTLFYNLLGALAMLLGRFVPAVAVLALAGSLAGKKYVPPSLGTLPTDQAPFVLWLVLVILIVGALTFFPALAMGPVVEHFQMVGA